MLENAVQELTLQLHKAREDIFGLGHMNGQLSNDGLEQFRWIALISAGFKPEEDLSYYFCTTRISCAARQASVSVHDQKAITNGSIESGYWCTCLNALYRVVILPPPALSFVKGGNHASRRKK